MKTTIDLPDELVRKLKLRALRDRRKFKDLAADFLRRGLLTPPNPKKTAQPLLQKDKKTGLPVLQCPHPAAPGRDLTPDQLAEILNDQEADWIRESP
jgi:plasmid stability protein